MATSSRSYFHSESPVNPVQPTRLNFDSERRSGRVHEFPPRPNSAAGKSHPPSAFTNNYLRRQRSFHDLINEDVQAPTSSGRPPRIPPRPLPIPSIPIHPPQSSSKRHGRLMGYKQPPPSTPSTDSASSRSSFSSESSLFSANSAFSDVSSATSISSDDDKVHPKEVDTARSMPLGPGHIEGFGSLLWTRITNAAEHLTINVSKALETNISTYLGETTPAGQDSPLTQTMKKYYLSKAQHPSDLPGWLFDEPHKIPQPVFPAEEVDRGTGEMSHMPSQDRLFSPSVTPTPILLSQSRPLPRIESTEERSRARSLTRTASQARTGRSASHSRVRFVEQIHPRRMASHGNLRETTVEMASRNQPPPVPLRPIDTIGQEGLGISYMDPGRVRVKAKLADVNIKGKRPCVGGLPSGVRLTPVRNKGGEAKI